MFNNQRSTTMTEKTDDSTQEVAKADIVERWETVRTLRDKRNRTWISPDGSVINESSLPDEFYNLPLVLAYEALETTLGALEGQGRLEWRHPKIGLKEKMKTAKKANLCW